jgi:uncharacterized membrane protein
MNIIIGAIAVILAVWVTYLIETNDDINPN